MTNVAILWHMHQPNYEDHGTGEHILPWVRLHALKDYYGMVALLREFPDVKLTFNLVPSLLAQLEAFAEERARDRHLELGLKPVQALTDDEKSAMLREFFHAPRGHLVDPYPRYAELLQKRGAGGGFTDADILDLQVWHKLAWVDPFYLEDDPRVRRLIAQQRNFSEADKLLLWEVELEILRRTIPEYRAAAERGQAELSTSPFYHPILPLLCDTDIYLRTHPTATVPRPPFRHAEDARAQLRRAREFHERLFGHPPAGLWPSEGSVSDAVASLAAQLGFRWMATDEAILGRAIGREFRRDRQGRLEQPEALYRPYTIRIDASEIGCLFRDRELSDRVGFVYAGWDAETAASDFVDRLVDAGRRFAEDTGGEEATISIILDGENAWEHFHGGGRPFLRSLYGKLSGHPELRTVTMAEAAGRTPRPLSGIFPGSWIDGNFYIWIGHADDRRAWRQLREARRIFDQTAATVSGEDRERAFQELLIAEGSDWFWWYGDDHSSDHDLVFDDLFRRHLRHAYQLLGQPIPEELFATNISTGGVPPSFVEPAAFVTPELDGRSTSYFEWLAAGIVETQTPAGAMQTSERNHGIALGLLYGFDLQHLYIRLDLAQHAGEALAGGLACTVHFTSPGDLRLAVFNEGPRTLARVDRRSAEGQWNEIPGTMAQGAADTIIEASVSFSSLGLTPGNPFGFFVSLDKGATEVERYPAHRPVEGLVPSR